MQLDLEQDCLMSSKQSSRRRPSGGLPGHDYKRKPGIPSREVNRTPWPSLLLCRCALVPEVERRIGSLSERKGQRKLRLRRRGGVRHIGRGWRGREQIGGSPGQEPPGGFLAAQAKGQTKGQRRATDHRSKENVQQRGGNLELFQGDQAREAKNRDPGQGRKQARIPHA